MKLSLELEIDTNDIQTYVSTVLTALIEDSSFYIVPVDFKKMFENAAKKKTLEKAAMAWDIIQESILTGQGKIDVYLFDTFEPYKFLGTVSRETIVKSMSKLTPEELVDIADGCFEIMDTDTLIKIIEEKKNTATKKTKK